MNCLVSAARCRKTLSVWSPLVQAQIYGCRKASMSNRSLAKPTSSRPAWPSNEQIDQTVRPHSPSEGQARPAHLPETIPSITSRPQSQTPSSSNSISESRSNSTYQQAPSPSQPTRLHIQGLPFTLTASQDLLTHFLPYGRISHVFLPTNHRGQPAGYGFVEYRDSEDAKYAMEMMDGAEIDGRRVRVGWARVTGRGQDKSERKARFEEERTEEEMRSERLMEERHKRTALRERQTISAGRLGEHVGSKEEIARRSLFVGNVHDLTEQDLREAFLGYGVVHVKWPWTKQGAGFVHIELETEDDAIRALNEMDKVYIGRQLIKVERPRGKRQRSVDDGDQGQSQSEDSQDGNWGRFGEGKM